MLDPEHPFVNPTEFPYFSSMSLDKNIASVKKDRPDDRRHDTQLGRRCIHPEHRHELCRSCLPNTPISTLLKKGKPSEINQKPVGTGPYAFQRYQKDSNIHYHVANKDYWDPSQVKLDNLIFSINTDASARMQKLRKNECQVSLNPRPADVASLKSDPTLQVIKRFQPWLSPTTCSTNRSINLKYVRRWTWP